MGPSGSCQYLSYVSITPVGGVEGQTKRVKRHGYAALMRWWRRVDALAYSSRARSERAGGAGSHKQCENLRPRYLDGPRLLFLDVLGFIRALKICFFSSPELVGVCISLMFCILFHPGRVVMDLRCENAGGGAAGEVGGVLTFFFLLLLFSNKFTENPHTNVNTLLEAHTCKQTTHTLLWFSSSNSLV